ncbi:RNA-binding S4 domain-containing protein [Streptodolium elevatio]|uniref:RNA-binding S4 domain-containing protein n=1 Tax=Streptodolium elevatio TaxID=3157996 RepID=A0ABV3DFU4_9ACTN
MRTRGRVNGVGGSTCGAHKTRTTVAAPRVRVGHMAGTDGNAPTSVRVDAWIWAVRLTKTRSIAAAACKAGHVRVNGDRVKPAQSLKIGDEVRMRLDGRERIVVVTKLILKRVGAPVAVECYTDNSPPPPPREVAAAVGIRDRGTGRPTKRDRRLMDQLRSGPGAP